MTKRKRWLLKGVASSKAKRATRPDGVHRSLRALEPTVKMELLKRIDDITPLDKNQHCQFYEIWYRDRTHKYKNCYGPIFFRKVDKKSIKSIFET